MLLRICGWDIAAQNSQYPPYQKIYQWVVSNPQFLANEYQETTKNVVDKGCTHLGVFAIKPFFLHVYFSGIIKMQFLYLDTTFKRSSDSYGFQILREMSNDSF